VKSWQFNLIVGAAIVLAIAVLGGGKLAWAHWMYDDWRCAFAQCRIEVKP
jgi:hypothetical protein